MNFLRISKEALSLAMAYEAKDNTLSSLDSDSNFQRPIVCSIHTTRIKTI